MVINWCRDKCPVYLHLYVRDMDSNVAIGQHKPSVIDHMNFNWSVHRDQELNRRWMRPSPLSPNSDDVSLMDAIVISQ